MPAFPAPGEITTAETASLSRTIQVGLDGPLLVGAKKIGYHGKTQTVQFKVVGARIMLSLNPTEPKARWRVTVKIVADRLLVAGGTGKTENDLSAYQLGLDYRSEPTDASRELEALRAKLLAEHTPTTTAWIIEESVA
jgi:hypothetical protein